MHVPYPILKTWTGAKKIDQSTRDGWVWEIVKAFEKDPNKCHHHISCGDHTVVGLRYGNEIIFMDCRTDRRASVYLDE
jgi:hypothetical protein